MVPCHIDATSKAGNDRRIIQLAEMATGQILLGDKSYACDVTSLPSIGTRHFPRRPGH